MEDETEVSVVKGHQRTLDARSTCFSSIYLKTYPRLSIDSPPPPPQLETPNRMESLLISNQISAYCTQINKFAGSSFEKLFLAGSLQKS